MANIRSTVKKPPTVGENGSDNDGISRKLDELQAMSIKNNDTRSIDKEVRLAGYRTEAAERMAEAGINMREFLLGSDDAVLWERWLALSPGERECLGKATPLRSVEALVSRRVQEFNRQAEVERKANLKRVKYPSISRRSFEDLDREPDSPGGVIMEERRYS